tara:strand:- start:614 stop:1027 length:414 start_codon:yes stop_codon:yes gene_type:complete
MIEAFNGWIIFILYLLNLAGGGYYAYQSVLNTENFMEKYGIHKSALLPARLAGSFVLTTFLMGLYIIYRGGPEGTWIYFTILFIQSLIFTILGYISVNSEVAEMEGVEYTPEGYIAPAIFTVINAILIYGLSDKIYV